MKNILQDILEVKKSEVKNLRSNFTLSSFTDSKFYETKTLSFINRINAKNNCLGIIAEVKKASPSKGIIRENFNHLKIADIYFNQDVDAVSVLTDKTFFKGDISFLRDIAEIKSAPVLRKDFIIDEYQIFEAKSCGADIILLISEALSKSQINELSSAAFEIGLEVLLELHSEDELKKINFSQNKLIGINNRNLKTFKTDLGITETLSAKVPDDIIIVSESGISSKDDIAFLRGNTPSKAVLVGEHLMKAEKIEDELKKLKEWCCES